MNSQKILRLITLVLCIILGKFAFAIAESVVEKRKAFVEIGLNRGQTLRELISLRQSTDTGRLTEI